MSIQRYVGLLVSNQEDRGSAVEKKIAKLRQAKWKAIDVIQSIPVTENQRSEASQRRVQARKDLAVIEYQLGKWHEYVRKSLKATEEAKKDAEVWRKTQESARQAHWFPRNYSPTEVEAERLRHRLSAANVILDKGFTASPELLDKKRENEQRLRQLELNIDRQKKIAKALEDKAGFYPTQGDHRYRWQSEFDVERARGEDRRAHRR